MHATIDAPVAASTVTSLQHTFVNVLLPRIEQHARIAFRDIRCSDRRADCTAEARALAWKWFVRLAEHGKDATRFGIAPATLVARAVRCGRRLCGQEKAKDALSPLAQRRHGFVVSSLPQISTLDGNVFDEALQDNTRTAVPDQVAFRCDFPTWLTTRTERDRRVVEHLVLGNRTKDVAQRFGMTPGRVSQLRRDFHDDWQSFCEESPSTQPGADTSAA